MGENEDTRRRKIAVVGREIEETVFLYEMSDTEARTLRYLGSPDAVNVAQVQTRVLEVLGAVGMGTEAIRDALDEPRPSRRQVLDALTALAQGRRISREPSIGASVQGKRVAWFAPAANLARSQNLMSRPCQVPVPHGSEYRTEPERPYSEKQLGTADTLGSAKLKLDVPPVHNAGDLLSLGELNEAHPR